MGNKFDGTGMNVRAQEGGTPLAVREKPNNLYVWGFLWHTLLKGL